MDILVLIVILIAIPFGLGIAALAIAIKGYNMENDTSVVYLVNYKEKGSPIVVFKCEDDAIAYQRQYAPNSSIHAYKII